eukprot:TRINITY_DN36028_c0_g1_i1.p1 TRINITY_DN36028_c0_g1~~TRINITY_DN36028_c0_g1_i1.p1  ORF type:complete len:687 (-),score=82.89 TRINITY_DN36028_c0_g1_i1:337-2397(-)
MGRLSSGRATATSVSRSCRGLDHAVLVSIVVMSAVADDAWKTAYLPEIVASAVMGAGGSDVAPEIASVAEIVRRSPSAAEAFITNGPRTDSTAGVIDAASQEVNADVVLTESESPLEGFPNTTITAAGDLASPTAILRFWDMLGQMSTLMFFDDYARWCISSSASGRCHSVTAFTLSLDGPCLFRLRGGPFFAVISIPRQGPIQRAMMKRFLHEARSRGLSVVGQGAVELDTWPAGDSSSNASVGGVGAVHNDSNASGAADDFPVFRVLADPASTFGSVVSLRLPGDWRSAAKAVKAGKASPANTSAVGSLCLAIVRRPEHCNCCAFSGMLSACLAEPLWDASDLDRFLGVQVPLPSFSVIASRQVAASGSSAIDGGQGENFSGHWVCMRGGGAVLGTNASIETASPVSGPGAAQGLIAPRLLGRLEYVQQPKVVFNNENFHIGVRTFLNPGWHKELRFSCERCSSRSKVVIRSVPTNAFCRDLRQQGLVAVVSAALHGQMPASVVMSSVGTAESELLVDARKKGVDHAYFHSLCEIPETGPCQGYFDQNSSLGIGLPLPQTLERDPDLEHAMTFVLDGASRLESHNRRKLLHRRNAVCLYPEEDLANGWLVGFAVVRIDSSDMQVFVIFVCFFGVALPLICLITALMHYNKLERCRDHLHQMQLNVQRAQLDTELQRRHGEGVII